MAISTSSAITTAPPSAALSWRRRSQKSRDGLFRATETGCWIAIAPPEETWNSGGFVIEGRPRVLLAGASGRDTHANFAQFRPFRSRLLSIAARSAPRGTDRPSGAHRGVAPRGFAGGGRAGAADPPVHEHGDLRVRRV